MWHPNCELAVTRYCANTFIGQTLVYEAVKKHVLQSMHGDTAQMVLYIYTDDRYSSQVQHLDITINSSTL